MSSTALVMDQTIQAWGQWPWHAHHSATCQGCTCCARNAIKIEVVEGGFFVGVAGQPKLTLAQKLKAFDPKIYGGKVMVSGLTGAEAGCLLNDCTGLMCRRSGSH